MISIIHILFTTAFCIPVELIGEATSVDNKTKVYSERHLIVLDEKGLNKNIKTIYFDTRGKLFAEMISDFSINSTIPNIKFTDNRFKKIEELRVDKNQKFVVYETTEMNNKPTIKKFEFQKNMVAGQGFDNFLKINFEKLLKTPLPLNFGVLSEMDFYSFNAYKKSESKNIIQFGIKISNIFLRLFTNELTVEYDSNTHQIKSYQGLSNILTDEGKSQNVKINYSFPKILNNQ